MPSRRFHLRACAPPVALAAVTGLVTAVIATGHPAAGLRPLAAATLAVGQMTAGAVVPQSAAETSSGSVAQADVARALAVLGPARDGRPGPGGQSSRGADRTPLHPWVRPNIGPLTSPFGYRWGRLHAGIDLAGPYGSPIVAATDGCITYAGPMNGYGEVTKITDWDGTETVYGHMSEFVRHSGCVRAGETIARVGSAGDATGPHLHFEVRIGGVPINPLPFLAKRGLYI
jgi:murein DD-endopeptidase MepM/ murein hydrolase activator NlpD